MSPESKTCTKCGEAKPTDQFATVTERGKTRLRSLCNPCKRARDRDYTNNRRNLETQMQSNKNWQDKNREYYRAYKQAYWLESQGKPVPFVGRRDVDTRPELHKEN